MIDSSEHKVSQAWKEFWESKTPNYPITKAEEETIDRLIKEQRSKRKIHPYILKNPSPLAESIWKQFHA